MTYNNHLSEILLTFCAFLYNYSNLRSFADQCILTLDIPFYNLFTETYLVYMKNQ